MNEYIRLEYKDCFSERPDEILHYPFVSDDVTTNNP